MMVYVPHVGEFLFVDDFPPFSPGAVAVLGVHLTSGIGVHMTLARTFHAGALVTEKVRLVAVVLSSLRYRQVISDPLRLVELLRLVIPVALMSGFGIHEVHKIVLALRVMIRLGLHDHATPSARYVEALTQALRYRDVARFFLGEALADSVSVLDSVSRHYRAVSNSQEGLVLAELFGGSLLFRLDLADDVDVDDFEVVNMLYKGDALLDTINMFAAYIDPGGGFTTWAINTRTSAVSEYQNYVFNSISRTGNKFLGADSTGLWELDGELDDTESITTRIKNGIMQLAGSHFTSFKAAYLGLRIRGDARDFVLKLHAGDGREYVYAVRPSNMQTTRVNMGKGLRSRYFSFELVTAGEDYDLDSVEFIPIGSKRRI